VPDSSHHPSSLAEIGQLVTVRQICEIVGLKRSTIETLLRRPDAPAPMRPNLRVRLWREAHVVEFLLALQQVPENTPTRDTGAPVVAARGTSGRRGGRPRTHHI